MGRRTPEAFREFITAPIPDGLQTTEETLRALLRDCPEERAMFELALSRGRGGNNNPSGVNQHAEEEEAGEANHDNVMVGLRATPPAEQGNSVPYAIRRLSKHRPDLVTRVGRGRSPPARPAAAAIGAAHGVTAARAVNRHRLRRAGHASGRGWV